MTRPRGQRSEPARLVAGLMLALLAVLVLAISLIVIGRGMANGPPPFAAASPLATNAGVAGSSPTGTPSSTTTAASVLPQATPTAGPTATPRPTTTPPPTPSPPPEIPVDATLDASLARCPIAAEIALVDSRITMTFVDDPTTPDLVCRAADGSADLTRLQERAYQAVLVMRRIPFDEPLPWTERRMFGWFTRTVSGIRFEDVENSYCCFRDREIVIRSDPNMLHLLDNHWAAREEPHWFGLMALPGLLAHEARHAEGYPHTCGSDDETFEEMGAWAVHMLWFRWLAEHAPGEYMRPVGARADLYVEVARDFEDDYYSSFCTPYAP